MTYSFATAVWVAEITVWDRVAAAATTLYVATGGSFTDAGAHTFVRALQQPALASRTAFDDHRTTGRGRVSIGQIVIANPCGIRDDWFTRYNWDGRAVALKRGAIGGEYSTDFVVAQEATLESALCGPSEITLSFRDWSRAFAVPLQSTLYAGTNVNGAGLEGTEDVRGKPKPIFMGRSPTGRGACELVLVNAQKNIWQASDDELASIPAVYDRGVNLAVGLTWISQTSGFGASDIGCIAYGNGLWVAVGAAGKLYTSPDGVTWTSRTSGFGGSGIFGVIYGGGMWVIIGASGLLSSSPDGITWTSRTSGFGASTIANVAYGDGLFVAVGVTGLLSTSPDGITWTARTSGFGATTIQSAAWGSIRGVGRWVIVGNSGTAATSPDGITWTLVTDSSFGSNTIRFVRAGGPTLGLFVASGDAGTMATSLDGYSWSQRPSSFGAADHVYSIAYGDGLWLAIGEAWKIATSADGITWTQVTSVFSGGTVNEVAFGAHMFTAVGNAGALAITTAAAGTYASAADLEDDTLAPAFGTYKVFLDADGSYVRLGSPAIGRVTADLVQSATAADNTAGQLAEQLFDRAGFAGGDWSSADQTALDAAAPQELYFYSTTGDQQQIIDALDQVMGSVGAWLSSDAAGVIRFAQLQAPGTNLVTNPSSLASSPWAGVGTYTNAYATYDGVSFTRMQGDGTTNHRYQVVALTGDTTKIFAFKVHHRGATGQDYLLLYDNTSNAQRAGVILTFNADGTITFTATAGSLTWARLPEGSYDVRMVATAVTAAHTHSVYASDVSGGLSPGTGVTDWLAADFRVYDAEPDAVLTENANLTGLAQVASSDDNAGLPPYRTTLRYGKSYAPLAGTEIAGSVDPDARALLQQEWLHADTAIDAAIQAAHPFAGERAGDTLLGDLTDAEDEADRLQALHGVDRQWYDVPVWMDDTSLAIDLGDVVDLVSSRYGLGAGTRARVLGIAPDVGGGTITLSVWV